MSNKRVAFDELEILRSALKVWQKEFSPDYDNFDIELIIRKSLFVKEKLLPLLKECYPNIKNATYFVCDKTQGLYSGLLHLLRSEEYVVVEYDSYQRYINVSGDSLVAITEDVLKNI